MRATRKTLRIIGVLALLLTAGAWVGALSLRDALKRSIIANLQEHFQSDVQIGDLQIIVFPHIFVTARDIVLRPQGRTDLPPLITIQELALSASIPNLIRRHISSVHLQGLQIRVPPRRPGPPSTPGIKPGKKIHFPLVIDQIVSDDALLETLPSDAQHAPHDFNIHRVVLTSFSFDGPASFSASLTNPQPIGEIDSQGQFGPWIAEQPGDTAVSGTFRYSHADFSSIHGLSGIMSSQGKYGGTLDRIHVEGDTEMPDFALSIAGNPMPLATHYVAVVDGTTGNTYLNSVEAVLGTSPISVNGEIVGIPGVKGRHIVLDATSTNARAEDLFHLALKGAAPLQGTISLHTKIDVPPAPAGSKDVIDHLSLDGQFGIGDAHFSNPAIQGKLDSLSRAGQGQPKNENVQDVIFNLRGRFLVGRGVANLSGINFNVPGAAVDLNGSYDLRSGDIDFHGHLTMDAKLSQTTVGAKSVVLRLFDPFFKKDGGGSSIPIAITGNRSHPRIGLDLAGKRSGSKP